MPDRLERIQQVAVDTRVKMDEAMTTTDALDVAQAGLRLIEAIAATPARKRGSWETAPSVAGSDTSEEAALLIGPKMARLRAAVLRYLAVCGRVGATDEEIQRALRMSANTERPRRCELEGASLVVRTATTRLTQAGRRAHVYVVTPRGSAWVERSIVEG